MAIAKSSQYGRSMCSMGERDAAMNLSKMVIA
jgi:hypothetical protein